MRNNPINASDPSGRRPCDGDGADTECDRSSLIDYRSESKENQKVSLPVAPPTPYVFEGGCSGPNPSVVCKDPSLISNGQVETNTVYPVLKIPGNYEGPFIDEGCTGSPLCWLLVGADIVNFLQYQTNLPAKHSGYHAVANINYEVHKNFVSTYTVISSLEIVNRTNGKLSLREVTINDSIQFKPVSSISVDSGQSLTVRVQPYHIPGSSGAVRMNFTSDLYSFFVLIANYP